MYPFKSAQHQSLWCDPKQLHIIKDGAVDRRRVVVYRQIPLIERKAALKKLLAGSKLVRCVQHIEEKGEAFFAEVDRLALEGIVAKRASSMYSAGRTRQWLKIKTVAGRPARGPGLSIDITRSSCDRSRL